MGKGYNNYMCKKPFHPGSKANIKRTWMAEQKTESEKQKQEELRVQYEKEQELYNNKALLSKENKDKLALNFMYEAPPGAKKERQKEDDEPEYKFEWQRKYNAPREDFAKNNKEIRDQPFGIPVRNVRCIKCHQWGHVNTDRECPLYHQAGSSSLPSTSMDPLELMRQMREEGLALKQSILGHHLDSTQNNQHFVASDEEEDPEMQFLKALSLKQKKKLLRKLNKLADPEKSAKKKKKKDRKKKKDKRKRRNSAYSSDSETSRKEPSKHSHRRRSSSTESSTTNSSSDDRGKQKSRESTSVSRERSKHTHSENKSKKQKHRHHESSSPENTKHKKHKRTKE